MKKTFEGDDAQKVFDLLRKQETFGLLPDSEKLSVSLDISANHQTLVLGVGGVTRVFSMHKDGYTENWIKGSESGNMSCTNIEKDGGGNPIKGTVTLCQTIADPSTGQPSPSAILLQNHTYGMAEFVPQVRVASFQRFMADLQREFPDISLVEAEGSVYQGKGVAPSPVEKSAAL